MKRRWFKADDGTYYRNCPLIMGERDRTPLWRLREQRRLEDEWWEAFRKGVIRKFELGRGDVAVEPASFREAYPRHPGLWVLDEESDRGLPDHVDVEAAVRHYTIKRDREWPRHWLMHCAACKVDVHCASWDVAVLMMGCEHGVHTTAARGSKVAAVVHPMTGEPLSSVQVWRDRNLFFRLPEFGGASL